MRTCLALLLVFGLLACGDSNTGPSAVVVSMQFVAGDSQSAPINTPLTSQLAVQARDAEGNPVNGVIVNFVVTDGLGSVFAPTVLVDGTGIARNQWTLGRKAGLQTVEARAVDQSGNLVTYDTAYAIAIAGPGTTFGRTRFPIDAFGNERIRMDTSTTVRMDYWYLDAFDNRTTTCTGSAIPTIDNPAPTWVTVTARSDERGSYIWFERGDMVLSSFWVRFTFDCYGTIKDSVVVQPS